MGRPAPTKNGHDFFAVSSLLQKAIRRGDVEFAARACNELLPKYANYCWNRLMIISAEDCAGLVTQEVIALWTAWRKTTAETSSKKPGRVEGRIFFAKAIVLLAKCQHSRDQDNLILLVSNRMPDDVFREELTKVADVFRVDDGDFEIPEWVHDVHTAQGRRKGATLDDFIRDEEAALSNPAESIFQNFDEMVETWGYVTPKTKYPKRGWFGDDEGGA